MVVVRLRKSRVKARSIENLFDSGDYSTSDTPVQYEEHVSAFHPPRDSRLSSTDIRPEIKQPPSYNTTINHRFTTDHRPIAVSTTAVNLPVSVGPLKGEREY